MPSSVYDAQSSLPNMNPTGGIGLGGVTPGTGGPGNYNMGNAGNTNPSNSGTNPWVISMPSSTAPTTTMTPGQQGNLTSANVGSNALNPYNIPGTQTYTGNAQSFGNELGKVYGQGEGSLLYNYLQSGAGYSGGLTQQAVDTQIAAMQHQIGEGAQSLLTLEGSEGISPSSSSASLALGDYFSQATAEENAITAQEFYNMWNASQNRETNIIEGTMQGTGSYQANKPGFFGTLSNILNLGSAGTDLWTSLAGIIPGLG